ncbi:MAG: DUF2894 domain-containing protein [Azoarcus sp.]
MVEAGHAEAGANHPPPNTAADALIDALRARGAEGFDPVGWRFIEAMARRVANHRGDTRRILDRRLAEIASAFGERFERASASAQDALIRGKEAFPQDADALQQHADAGDFAGLHRALASLQARDIVGPLTALLDHIGAQTAVGQDRDLAPANPAAANAHGELKSMRYFRSTWSTLSVDRQLSHSLAQAPENAGPLNSHFLVLQSLTLMRDIAPEYLTQFMSYVDALLWLEQADSSRNPAPKNATRGEREKKRKPARGKTG